jgi:phenylacetate-CoA ligase
MLARLDGGILGRVDDMVYVRGVNVYPSAIEAVVRRFDAVAEYRATVSHAGSLRELSLDVELVGNGDGAAVVIPQLTAALREALALTVPIRVVDMGGLPRFEMKARRFVIQD